MSGIYIHIPFCKQACNYCDFYFSTNLLNKDDVVDAILREIELRHTYLPTKEIKSIYIGGGSPSLLSEKNLMAIMAQLKSYFSWETTIEITLEANPDDINARSLTYWKACGINRLSIGLQSFNEDELKWMNRAHNAIESISSVKLAQDLGFENISIDLIYGSKFQTLKTWEETLQKAIQLNTPHISSYNLTIENKTALGVKNKRGEEPLIDESLSSKQFVLMIDALSDSNFVQYEISNFAKKNFFAIHNSNYWLQKMYLGIGPSAHSFDGVSRQWNVKNNILYLKALNTHTNFFEKEQLTVIDRYNEYVLTRLRTIWGCDESEINLLFGDKIFHHFKKNIASHKQFIIKENGVYTLNKAGKLRADGIASDLFIV